jgi:hypothetical protein
MSMIDESEYQAWVDGHDERIAKQRARAERDADREANPSPLRRLGRTVGRALNKAADDAARGVPLVIDRDHDTLIYQGRTESLREVTATVTAAGAVRSRPTMTRFVGFGLLPGVSSFAALVAQKKVDERELYLVIDGPDWQWAIKADPKRSANVRALAAEINTASRRLK